MTVSSKLLRTLRTWHRLPAGELRERLEISRPTLMRAILALGPDVVTRGQARRTAYAARRPVRGNTAAIPLFRVDEAGRGSEVALLDPLYPHGCAMQFQAPFEWPLLDDMREGWFEGFPYPLDDMRPQGFLGRQLVREEGPLLQAPDNPRDWSDDDALHAMSLLGTDLPGNYLSLIHI